ncbi:MAG: hypothetical protein KDK07_12030 [Bauldia sp.]|nr:hypothetical protein [Bauldia sp.]
MNASNVRPPTSGPELSNYVSGIIVRFVQVLDLAGCHKPTMSNALILAATAASIECRGPRYVAAELRKLADSLDGQATEIEAAMKAADLGPKGLN